MSSCFEYFPCVNTTDQIVKCYIYYKKENTNKKDNADPVITPCESMAINDELASDWYTEAKCDTDTPATTPATTAKCDTPFGANANPTYTETRHARRNWKFPLEKKPLKDPKRTKAELQRKTREILQEYADERKERRNAALDLRREEYADRVKPKVGRPIVETIDEECECEDYDNMYT